MGYRKSNVKKRNFRRRRPYRPRAKKGLVSTIKSVSKAVALKEAETKRVYFTVTNQDINNNLGLSYWSDVMSDIPQAGAGEASWENRRIGNTVQPCWLKGFIFIRNIHHGTFDHAKNYSIRVMVMKDKNNIMNDPQVSLASLPLYRKEGVTSPVAGTLYDNLRDVDWRAWEPLMDKQYKLFQYSTMTAGQVTPFLKIPVSINLTKCTFDFDRANSQLSKENIVLFVQTRPFTGAQVGTQSIQVSYELALSFKDI